MAVAGRYNLSLVSQPPTPNLRTRLRRIALKSILVLVGTSLLAFALDYLIFRIRVATNANPYGSLVVSHYTAVLQKNGKTTFTFDPPQPSLVGRLVCRVAPLHRHAAFSELWCGQDSTA